MTSKSEPRPSPPVAGLPWVPLSWISRVAPALRVRNFRIFWLAQIVSIVGTSLQVVAEGWLIYQLTESTFWLGMVGFLALIPVLPISLVGGVLIDRVARRKLIMATQTGLFVQAVIFGLLVLSGTIRLWHVIVLYFIFGAILAIDHPARRAFLVELVDEPRLANAVALNATIFNFSGLIGYALAGLLIASLGAGPTMLLNAFTYLVPIYALSRIRVADVGADTSAAGGARPPFHKALWEGAAVLWRQPAILGTISLMAVVGGLAWPVYGMMPAYAEAVLGVGAVGLGILMAVGALGSIIGTAAVARLGAHGRGRILTVGSIVLPLLVMAFAFSRNMVLACVLLVGIGAALLVVQSLAITLVQVNIPDRVRGRVMTIYSILHAGSDTGGNLAVGWLATAIGLPLALGLAGAGALLYALGLRAALPDLHRLD